MQFTAGFAGPNFKKRAGNALGVVSEILRTAKRLCQLPQGDTQLPSGAADLVVAGPVADCLRKDIAEADFQVQAPSRRTLSRQTLENGRFVVTSRYPG